MQEMGLFQLLGVVWRSSQYGVVDDHELMVMGEWHDGPQDLVTPLLCILNASVFIVIRLPIP